VEECSNTDDWLLLNELSGKTIIGIEGLIRRRYPNLGRGMDAAAARTSHLFTEFDGAVPEAGADRDPASPGGPVVSASRLETAGTCPLRYFFKYILKIEPPEEIEIRPFEWLDQLEVGSLMHEVFEVFYTRLNEQDRLPAPEDEAMLFSILDELAEQYRKSNPPPADNVYRRQIEALRAIARVFLAEEIVFARTSRPRYLEAAIGMPPGRGGTPLDSTEPAEVALPGGGKIRARGRIDRIDEIPSPDPPAFSIWDYKTGSTYKYRNEKDPFNQGRVIQHALYILMAEPRLKELFGNDASVAFFGYFFTNTYTRGERIHYPRERLELGAGVIENICRTISNGAFLATDDNSDCRYCDYIEICSDTETVAENASRKLDNSTIEMLESYRELRR